MRMLPLLLALAVAPAFAAEAPPPPDLQPVPDGPPGPGDAPAVTIKPTGKGKVEEYRANGKLYALKVTPKNGRPYYLIDVDGSGRFERQETLGESLHPPMWTVKEF